jgi:hypothetical protein
MSALLVGYARCSTDQQDLTAQRDALLGLGVEAERIYVDHGLIGTNRERPGLREALAACRAGDTLAVTKLDRLARSLPDARAIADELTTRQISLSLGGSAYDPTDAVGPTAIQRPRHGRRVRVRPDPAAYSRRDAGREGQRPAPRQAAQTQPETGSAPGLTGAQRRVQALSKSPSSSVSAAPPCTGPSNANGSRRRPTSRKRRRGAEATPWRPPSRIRHPRGTSGPSAFRRVSGQQNWSVSAWIFVVHPPRDRPSAWSAGSPGRFL